MSLGTALYFRFCQRMVKRVVYVGPKYASQTCWFSSEKPIFTPESTSPPIPQYAEKKNETVLLKRARLMYQSRKRGMLENGLLLSTFASKHLKTMTEPQLKDYDKLINQPTNDWEIYYWITGAKPTPDEYKSEVMDMLKEHAQNKNKEARIKQPGLYD